jgi:hypothetical protein
MKKPSILPRLNVLLLAAGTFVPSFGFSQQVFTVTNTADSGPGSLRQAISDANANPGPATIAFTIPGTGVHTISPINGLDPITNAITIDGYTQLGSSANTLPNGDNAVLLIELDGEFITGTPYGQFPYGLLVAGSGTIIRGLVINRCAGAAIEFVYPSNPQGVIIQGCFLGTDSSGMLRRPNKRGVDPFATRCLIGGTDPANRNVIAANYLEGIYMTAAFSNVVQGNFIGVAADGISPLGNGGAGIGLIGFGQSCIGTLIGGNAPGARNIISDNRYGVVMQGPASINGTVVGNIIGADVTGAVPLGNNQQGVFVTAGATGNSVGGTASGSGNLIAYNAWSGVQVGPDAGSTNNAILGNSIFANGRLGIALGNDDGITPLPNDPGDADSGPNNRQNYPVITSITQGSTNIIYSTLTSTPSATFRIEFFASASPDSTGYGEGQTFLGATNVTTDTNGLASTVLVCPCSIEGEWITVTATDKNYHNTSEFAAAALVCTPTVIISQPQDQQVALGSDATLTVGGSGTSPLAYRWQKNMINLSDSGNISGVATPNLHIASFSTNDEGNYTVIITNCAGSATSAVATLSTLYGPVITTQPQGQTLVAGSDVSLGVTVAGTSPISVCWFKNAARLSDGGRTVGAATLQLSITNAQVGDSGTYSVVVTNNFGSVTSAVAVVTILAVPPVIGQQPISLTLTQGSTASFSVVAYGAKPLSYQWLLFGIPVPGATNPVLPIVSAQSQDQGIYNLVVSNSGGAVISTNASLTLLLPPRIYQQAVGLVVTQSQSAVFLAIAGGSPPLSYQWVLNGTNLPGATLFRYGITSAQAPDSGNYQVIVSNAVGVALSIPATLDVKIDTNPPVILSATEDCDRSTILVEANKPLDASVARDPQNYFLTPPVAILGVNVSAQDGRIMLSTAALVPDTLYTLSVRNLKDVSGNVMSGVAEFPLFCQAGTPPVLSIAKSDTNATLYWTRPNYALQHASFITGPWEDLSPGKNVGPSNFQTDIVPGSTNDFFRLVRQPRAFNFAISSALQPVQPTLTGMNGGPPRPIGVVLSADGQATEFVENEIILRPTNPQQLAAFILKYGGTIMRDGSIGAIPGAPTRQGISPSPSGWYLIRVDVSQSGTDDLVDNMRAHGVPGPALFSSDAAARLVALKMRESNLVLGINILLHSDFVPEHPTSSGLCRDAEKWWYMTDSSDPLSPSDPGYPGLSIGVIHAWRYLSYLGVPPGSGSFNPTIIAIIDGGFALDQATGLPLLNNVDYPAPPAVPLQADLINTGPFAGGPNPGKCTGGAACPYHGQKVFGVAAAVPKNCYGTAGIGGPVAIPMLYKVENDLWQWADGIRWAAYNGADVINISAGGGCGMWAGFCQVPVTCEGAGPDWLGCDPYGYMAENVRMATDFGAVVVAAAGNDGKDITFSVDPIPAKTDRVIGVGAVDQTGSRKSYSNYGVGASIWAPTDTYTTITPDSPTDIPTFGGTSASTPFISGVIALMKALDPSLNYSRTLAILRETSMQGTDPQVSPGWVSAYRAVQSVRPNVAPSVSIRTPLTGSTIDWKNPWLRADVVDPEQGANLDNVMIEWESNVDGPLPSGVGPSHRLCEPSQLSLGAHVITVTATDPFGASGSDSVTVEVVDSAPVVNIFFPPPSPGYACSDFSLPLRAAGFDPEEGPNIDFKWWFDSPGNVLQAGHGPAFQNYNTLPGQVPQGSHTFFFSATDSQGVSSTASATFLVTAPCGVPFAQITSPGDGTMFDIGTQITFVGTGSDPTDGPLNGASLVWKSDIDGVLGTGSSLNVVLSGPTRPCDPEFVVHTVTLTVTDSHGHSYSTSIRVYIGRLC